MTTRIIPVDPFDLVVFGATGDLAQRKLLPALFHRDEQGQIPPGARIIGVSRRADERDEFRGLRARPPSKPMCAEAERTARGAASVSSTRLDYVAVDAAGGSGWTDLAKTLGARPGPRSAFSISPSAPISSARSASGSASTARDAENPRRDREAARQDLASAKALNDVIGKVFAERPVYRIDHYLGKETVQNLMALRFANALFEPLWNSAHIDHVQITVAETLGVEGRAGYYDTAGRAARHGAEPHAAAALPGRHGAADLDRRRCGARREAESAELAEADHRRRMWPTSRCAASIAPAPSTAARLPAISKSSARPRRKTETFVALKAEIDNWRWAGVPFYLRTGKRLAVARLGNRRRLPPIPHSVFDGAAGPIAANRLVIRLQPDEGVKLWLMIKDPGPGGMRLQHVPLDMSFAEAFGVRNPDAYERLLMDVVRGNQTLFMRRDEVEAAWSWIDPILDAWAASPDLPKPYHVGHLGPVRRRGADRARRAHLARGRGLMIAAERSFADRETLARQLAE